MTEELRIILTNDDLENIEDVLSDAISRATIGGPHNEYFGRMYKITDGLFAIATGLHDVADAIRDMNND
jgi:hypothetical protein